MKKLLAIVFVLLIAGCANLPTPPIQIPGTYVSPIKYKNFSCEELYTELTNLKSREYILVAAQENRCETGAVQAFWLGYGPGDGVEASELSNVRGEIKAVRETLNSKKCEIRAVGIVKGETKQYVVFIKSINEYSSGIGTSAINPEGAVLFTSIENAEIYINSLIIQLHTKRTDYEIVEVR